MLGCLTYVLRGLLCFLQSLHSTESLDLLALAASLVLEGCVSEGKQRTSHEARPPPPAFQLATGSRINRHVPEPAPTAIWAITGTPTILTTIDGQDDAALLFCSERLDDPLPEGTLPLDTFPRWHSAPGGTARQYPTRQHPTAAACPVGRASILQHQLPAHAPPSLSSVYGTAMSASPASPHLPGYTAEGSMQAQQTQHDIQILLMSAGVSLSIFAAPVFVLAAPTVGAFADLISLRRSPSAGTNAAPEHVSLGPAWALPCTSPVLAWGGAVAAPTHLSLGPNYAGNEDVDEEGRQAMGLGDQGGHHNLTKRKLVADRQVEEMPGAVLTCSAYLIARLCYLLMGFKARGPHLSLLPPMFLRASAVRGKRCSTLAMAHG